MPLGASAGIVAEEQVPHSPTSEGVPPTTPAMLGRIVQYVATWAQGGEVAPASTVIGWIVIEMRGGEIDGLSRHADIMKVDKDRLPAKRSAPVVAPSSRIAVPPNTIGADKLSDKLPVRAAALLAPALRPNETDEVSDLGPVDRIEPAMFRTDWHDPDSESSATRTKGESY